MNQCCLSGKYTHPAFLLVLIAFVAFISLGLPDGLLGVAWPSMRVTFGLPFQELGVLLSVMVLGYLAASSASGPLVARLGIGGLLTLSSATMTFALFGFALAPVWGVLVGLSLLSGLGAGCRWGFCCSG